MATFKQIAKGISRGAAIGFAIGAAIEFVGRERRIKQLVGLYEQAVLDKYSMSDELSIRTSQLWASQIEAEDLQQKLSDLKKELSDTIASYETLLSSYSDDPEFYQEEEDNYECY